MNGILNMGHVTKYGSPIGSQKEGVVLKTFQPIGI